MGRVIPLTGARRRRTGTLVRAESGHITIRAPFGKPQRWRVDHAVALANAIRWLVRFSTRKDGVCLDFTAGSGTSGIAALLEEMRWIGIELNDTEAEPYVRIACARIGYHERIGVQRSLFGEAG